MNARALAIVLVCAFAAAGAFARFAQIDELPPPADVMPDCEVVQPAQDVVRFEARDVFVDAGSTPLSAWQIEITDEARVASLVGVEGGEHPAFAAPPFYDARALMTERVVIAAFSTQAALPEGRVRVARLHYQITGVAEPRFSVQLVTAGSPYGSRIDASASIGN